MFRLKDKDKNLYKYVLCTQIWSLITNLFYALIVHRWIRLFTPKKICLPLHIKEDIENKSCLVLYITSAFEFPTFIFNPRFVLASCMDVCMKTEPLFDIFLFIRESWMYTSGQDCHRAQLPTSICLMIVLVGAFSHVNYWLCS